MNATEAKALLEPIPKEDFIVGDFTDGIGKCCAVGHLARLKHKYPKNYNVNNCHDFYGSEVNIFARQTTKKFLTEKHGIDSTCLATVNNENTINGYTEDNPKDRVIHLLDDMIAEGY